MDISVINSDDRPGRDWSGLVGIGKNCAAEQQGNGNGRRMGEASGDNLDFGRMCPHSLT